MCYISHPECQEALGAKNHAKIARPSHILEVMIRYIQTLYSLTCIFIQEVQINLVGRILVFGKNNAKQILRFAGADLRSCELLKVP